MLIHPTLSASKIKAGLGMGILNLMKYLMFVFNVLVFVSIWMFFAVLMWILYGMQTHVAGVGGSTETTGNSVHVVTIQHLDFPLYFTTGGICLFSVGIWVATDPDGFQSIIVSSPLLTAGAYLILFVGVALSFLGFLGCFGAIKQNRTILLLFFVLVLLVFTVEVVAAALILVNKKQIKDEFLLSDLQKNYQGDNASDVFSTSWNTIMIAFSCCGISGPDDFGNCSHFQEQQSDELWPRACCTRDKPLQTGHLLDWKRCKQREPEYINSQGCFFTIARTLQKYISIPGAFGLGVLGFEMFAMFFAFCLYYNFD